MSAITATGFGISLMRDAMGNLTGEGNGAESHTLDVQNRLIQISHGDAS